MSIVINTNVASLDAQRNLQHTQRSLQTNLARLSSGMRINSAADDSAGLGISERMKAGVRSYNQAQRNANDDMSLIQVADGAMNEQAGILTRLRELAVQSANGTNSSTDRGFIDTEAQQLTGELDRIATVTSFNGLNVLSTGATITGQVDINGTASDTIAMAFSKTDSVSLGVKYGVGNQVDLKTSGATAQSAITNIDAAINALSTTRASVGAVSNRIGVALNTLASASTNLSAANSRIRDVDVAEESAAMTRNQVLNQAGTAILAQANQLPQAALSLLGGR